MIRGQPARTKRGKIAIRRKPTRPPKRRLAVAKRKFDGKKKRPKTGPPPTYFSLLQDTVLTLKDSTKGASLREIRRGLEDKYGGRFDTASNKLLTSALQRLSNRGTIIHKKGFKYQLNAPKVPRARPAPSTSSFTSAENTASASTKGTRMEEATQNGYSDTSESQSSASAMSRPKSSRRS